jgi:uncharacterized damage-inducible protein DinB
MATGNPLEILLNHHQWATHQLLDACDKLTEEQFHQRFEMGPGSLHDTITHMISAIRVWTDVLANREIRPRPQGRRTSAELRELFEQSAAELATLARANPSDQIVKDMRPEMNYSYTRAGVAAHVTTHSMHHRAQCLNMLRHLGIKPLPPSSVAEWMRTVDMPAGK